LVFEHHFQQYFSYIMTTSLSIAYIIWHLLNIYFSQNLNTSIYNFVSNCQEYSLKWINKTAGFVKCFLVEYFKLDTNNVWKVLYKVSSFYANWMKNMAAWGNSWFWWADFQKKRLARSQPSSIPSSYSNETMPNAEQFMLTLSEHQTIQPVLVGVYMARALVA
jgi:carboxypeptidase C (cathepsin A)